MIRKKLDKKWQLKIICLLLAIILWFFIINEQNPISEGSYTVPVAIENLDSQYITSNVPKTVYIRLSGPRNTIINVGTNDVRAYIDMSNAQEGEMDVPVHVVIPNGTELKKQSLTTAKITVDVYTVKELPITPHIAGKLDGNNFISTLKVIPEKVVVSGARRLIQQVDKAVISIPVGGKDEDFSMMAPIHLLDANGSPVDGLELTPWQSNVKVSIDHNGVTKTIPLNVSSEGTLASGYKVKEFKATPGSVDVKGPASLVTDLTSIDLQPIDIDGLHDDKTWTVTVPPITGVDIEPSDVDVSLTVEKE